MTWDQVCADPSLRDLPFKIETNEFGQVTMSLRTNRMAIVKSRMLNRLADMNGAQEETIPNAVVETSDGVKVVDVAWMSPEFRQRWGVVTPYPEAPDLCVEMFASSVSPQWAELKRDLYFERGAKEVWICPESGDLRFFSREREVERSELFPSFPKSVMDD